MDDNISDKKRNKNRKLFDKDNNPHKKNLYFILPTLKSLSQALRIILFLCIALSEISRIRANVKIPSTEKSTGHSLPSKIKTNQIR